MKNYKFKVRNFKLNLPKKISIKQVNPLVLVLDLVEIIGLLLLPILIILPSTEANSFQNWIGIIVIMFIGRLIRTMFLGTRSLPQVKFDLSVLSVITLLLVLNLLNSGNDVNSRLGGETMWGIGVLMLAGLTLYLLTVIARKGFLTRLLIFTTVFTFSLKFLVLAFDQNTIFIARSYIFAHNLLPVVIAMISLAGIFYFRSAVSKAVMAGGLVASVILVLYKFDWAVILLGVLAFLGLGAVQLIAKKRVKSSLKKDLEIDLNNYRRGEINILQFIANQVGLFSILIFFSLLFTLAIGVAAETSIAKELEFHFESYINALQSIDSIQKLLIGRSIKGLSLGGVSASMQLLVEYGLAAIVAVIIVIKDILKYHMKSLEQTTKMKNHKREWVFQSACFLGLLFLLAGIFFTTLTVNGIYLLVVLIALVYIFYYRTHPSLHKKFDNFEIGVDNKDGEVVDFEGVSKLAFLNKIMPKELWMDVFQIVRILLVITLVAYTPTLIETIQKIF